MVNRTQMLVLGFFVLAVTSLLVILAAAPEVYDQALRLPTRSHALEITFLAALVGFLTLLSIGVMRRWRWTFWRCLFCSVNDAVNVLPCAAWPYLNGGSCLTFAAFPGRR
jgi:hypothetical protein